jgi:phenylacetate-coenzyme A ligase PaaK-like adenylate-forming protein
MLIVNGVNFFPKQIEQTLLGIPGIGNNYQIIVEEVDGVNDVRVDVEAGPGVTGYMVEKAGNFIVWIFDVIEYFPINAKESISASG